MHFFAYLQEKKYYFKMVNDHVFLPSKKCILGSVDDKYSRKTRKQNRNINNLSLRCCQSSKWDLKFS